MLTDHLCNSILGAFFSEVVDRNFDRWIASVDI